MCVRIAFIYSNFLVLRRGELRVAGCHVWCLVRIYFFNLFKYTASELAVALDYAASSPLVLDRESR